jgi:tetratricopeptide (TPR) repeat protein
VFLFSAAVEWVWQLAAIAATVLILGAVIVAGREEPVVDCAEPTNPVPARSLLVVLALVALAAVLVPFAGQLAVRRSQSAAARGDLAAALADSRAAERLQPYASSAHLQEALVLEEAGHLLAAAAAAHVATTDSPTDWTAWLTLARIDARRGATRAAFAELGQARRLNPLSSLFAGTP